MSKGATVTFEDIELPDALDPESSITESDKDYQLFLFWWNASRGAGRTDKGRRRKPHERSDVRPAAVHAQLREELAKSI